jgi:osmotically-inducible protein OsmY
MEGQTMKIINLTKYIVLLLTFLFCSPTFADATVNMDDASSNTISNADTGIEIDVKEKIENNPALTGFDITASSHQGVVTLKGTVDTREQEKAAIQSAKSANGVKSVQSNLSVNVK